MSNCIDPDETAHYEPSHLDLHSLQKPTIITYGSERVKPVKLVQNLALSQWNKYI